MCRASARGHRETFRAAWGLECERAASRHVLLTVRAEADQAASGARRSASISAASVARRTSSAAAAASQEHSLERQHCAIGHAGSQTAAGHACRRTAASAATAPAALSTITTRSFAGATSAAAEAASAAVAAAAAATGGLDGGATAAVEAATAAASAAASGQWHGLEQLGNLRCRGWHAILLPPCLRQHLVGLA